MLDIVPADMNKVVEHASELWSKFYGTVRVSGSSNRMKRCDLGRPRSKQGDAKPSMTKWIQRRRDAVLRKSETVVPIAPDAALWTEGHQKELQFQQAGHIPIISKSEILFFQKRGRCSRIAYLIYVPFTSLSEKLLFPQAKRIVRLAEEACAGRLQALESVPADELGLVLEAVQRKRENDAKYLSTANKRRKLREMPTLPSILHKPMFVLDREILQCVDFANNCVAKGLQASNIKERGVYVVMRSKSNPKSILAGE